MENTNNTNAIIPFSEVEKMGNVIAKSQLFGVKTPDQAIALMLIAQAEGLHPAIAARDYHIIQGRPSLKSDAMLSRFQQAGGKVKWDKVTDEEVTGTFSHPNGGTLSIAWDMKRAVQAELAGKDNWKKYPRQMLRARVISEGIRSVFPACVSGFYAPEEVQDFEPNKMAETENAVVVEDIQTINSEGHESQPNPIDDQRSAAAHSAPTRLKGKSDFEKIVVPFGYLRGKTIGEISEDKLKSLRNWCINNSKYPETVAAIDGFLSATDFPMFDPVTPTEQKHHVPPSVEFADTKQLSNRHRLVSF